MGGHGSYLAVTVAVAFVSGCLGPGLPKSDDPGGLGPRLVAAAEPLWNNPQTFPHPAYNYPTLTNVATGANIPEWWLPIEPAKLPKFIDGIDLVSESPTGVRSGAGMTVFGRLAVVPAYTRSSAVVDIGDPTDPQVLSKIPGRHRNVDLIAYPEGRLVAVFSTGQGILNVWEITNPSEPVQLADIKPTTGTHKVNVVPGTPIVYNANSNGGGVRDGAPNAHIPAAATGVTEIFDLSDPTNPVHVKDWANGYGCHHIYFWNNAALGKFRAICAGIEVTQIWDIADPKDPKVIVSIPVHHGETALPSTSVFAVFFSHFSILSADGDTLIVGDETGGGSVPPGCTVGPQRGTSAPTGALWFYDVRDERDPKLLGWYSPGTHLPQNEPNASCTAHHGRLVPDPEGKRELLAMAFYGRGTVLVDFTDPTKPSVVDQFNDGTETWEAQYYHGYIFTGDLNRGMDVLTLV